MILIRSLLPFILFLSLALQAPVLLAQTRIVHWADVEKVLQDTSDSLTVMNFWATWCRPCVAELPHFEKLRKSYRAKPVRFLYISLDFSEEIAKRVNPFVEKKLYGARVWLLNETDYNQWIGRLDPQWSGSIPATLLLHPPSRKRIFLAQELSEEELKSHIEQIINKSP